MRDQIIDQLVAAGVATGEEGEQARALLALDDGALVPLLCEAGFPEEEVLAAASRVTRMPRAPTPLLAAPRGRDVQGLDLQAFLALGAVPLAVQDGRLCVAFKDPEVALSEAARQLPEHRAFLAPASQVDGAHTALRGQPAPAEAASPGGRLSSSRASTPGGGTPIAAMLRIPAIEDDGWNESGVYRVQAREEVPDPRARRAASPPPSASPLVVDPAELDLQPVEVDAQRTVAVPPLEATAAAREDSDEGGAAVARDPFLGATAEQAPLPVSLAPDDGARTVAVAAPAELLKGAAAEPAPAEDAPTVMTTTPWSGASSPLADPAPATAPLAEAPALAAPGAAPPALDRASRTPSSGVPMDAAREKLVDGIDRYRTLSVLGRGGMATVYLAEDTETGAKVALKIMEPHLAEDPTFVERFRREMKTSASLDHDNIVRVLDCAEGGGSLYMAAEYVDAATLKELLSQMGGRVPGPVVVEVLYQALFGLAHAHDKRLVHRDLKPANLMLTSGGVLKVGDFGIAKSNTDNTITQTGMLFGTPAYMSPEQAYGQELDGRSDLFSIGTVCYELLTGSNPYNHDNMSTCLIRISKAAARHLFEVCPTAPPLLEAVLTKLMRQDRSDRYPAARDAAQALEPLVSLLRERYGNLLERALKDPTGTQRMLARDESALQLQRANALLAQNPEANRQQAAFRLYQASAIDPTYTEASQRLAEVLRQVPYVFDATPEDEALEELESALSKKPGSPALLRRGADLCVAKKNLLGAAVWMKRYLLVQPSDAHIARQLMMIVGDDPLEPWGAPEELSRTAAARGPSALDGSVSPLSPFSPGLPSATPENGTAAALGFGAAPRGAPAPGFPALSGADPASGEGQTLPALSSAQGPLVHDEISRPTGLVEPANGDLDRPARHGLPPWLAAHRGRLKAAGLTVGALVVLFVGVRSLFGLVGGGEPRPAKVSPAPAPAPVALPAPVPRPAEEAAPAGNPPASPDWTTVRARQQREGFEAARKQFGLGDLDAALSALSAALVLDAGSDLATDIRLLRGEAYLRSRRFEDARSDLARVLSQVAADDPRHSAASALLDQVPKKAVRKKRRTAGGSGDFQVGTFEQAFEEAQREREP